MPNWCYNELHIYGEPEDIKHFMEANKGLPAAYLPYEGEKGHTRPTELRFCFNALVPTPQVVLDLGFDGTEKRREIEKEYGKEAAAEMIDGLHWSIQNWGTKWDIYSSNLSLENCGWEEGLTEFVLAFSTAWSPPINWLVQVAPKFPKLRFDLSYEESGNCFAGNVICEGTFVEKKPYDKETCMKMFAF